MPHFINQNAEEISIEQLDNNCTPLPEDLAEKLFGFCISKAIISSFNLGIFDVINDAKGGISGEEIANQLQTNKEATVRLLDTLVSLDLIKKDSNNHSELYFNTPIADKFLLHNSSNSIKGIVPMLEKSYKLYGNLEWAVREGANQWRRTYNGFLSTLFFIVVDVYRYLFDASWDMFSLIYWTKRGIMLFLEGLQGSCKPESNKLVSAFDLSKFRNMCDLGGGTGDLAYAASSIYPNMKITVFDLPAVVDCAPSFKPSLHECRTQDRVRFMSGNFFKDSLPAADIYVLTRILQSFDEEKIYFILKKVYESLPKGGAVLICEKILDDNKAGPLLGNLSSLTMLVVGNKGSRERSGKEYRELLENCGFSSIQMSRNVGTFMDAIIAFKITN